MKITAFDDLYPLRPSVGGAVVYVASGSNSGEGDTGGGGDVTGTAGDYTVVGLRQTVSLASNIGGGTVGDVLTIVQTSPRLAMFATPSNTGATPDVELVSVAATGATETVDVSVARTYDLTLTADCTLTLSGAVTAEAWYLTLLLRQDGTGGRLVTWPGSVVWASGSAPTLSTVAGDVDVVSLVTVDGGTTWLGTSADSSVSSHLTDTTDAHDASAISIADAGTYFTSTDVEGALQEIGAGGFGGGEDTALVKDTNAGATQTVDCSSARLHDLTLTANCTITLTGATNGEYHHVRVILRQDGTGSWTVTWPASVYWPSGGSAPTLATGPYDADIIHLMTTDGGVEWYGHHEGAAYALSAPPSSGAYWPLLALTSA